jgi:hypothetical protein
MALVRRIYCVLCVVLRRSAMAECLVTHDQYGKIWNYRTKWRNNGRPRDTSSVRIHGQTNIELQRSCQQNGWRKDHPNRFCSSLLVGRSIRHQGKKMAQDRNRPCGLTHVWMMIKVQINMFRCPKHYPIRR